MMRMSIEQCGQKTNHTLVPGTGMCACTHAMFDGDPILDAKRPRCGFARGGGGRLCAHPEGEGHKGDHYFECSARSELWED